MESACAQFRGIGIPNGTPIALNKRTQNSSAPSALKIDNQGDSMALILIIGALIAAGLIIALLKKQLQSSGPKVTKLEM